MTENLIIASDPQGRMHELTAERWNEVKHRPGWKKIGARINDVEAEKGQNDG